MAEPTGTEDTKATGAGKNNAEDDGLRPQIAGENASSPDEEILLEDEEMPAALRGEDKSFSIQLLQFFLFPLLIVITALAVMIAFGVSGSSQSKVEDLLTDLRYGSRNSRQMAAYHLAQRFRREPQEAQKPEVAEELLTILETATELTPEMRMYVLLAGSWTGDTRFTPILLQEMEAFFAMPEGDRDLTPERGDAYAQALQRLADPVAVDPLIKIYDNYDEYGRLLAIHALGPIDDPRVNELLTRALDDEYSDVVWNAAIRLAADPRRDPAAAPVLAKLLDPEYVKQAPDILQEQIYEWLVFAARAAKALGDPALLPQLEALSENNQMPALVRAEARSAISALE